MKKIFILLIAVFTAVSVLADDYKTIEKENFSISWLIKGNTIHVRMSAETEGWIAVGFDAEKAMKGANIIIAYVKDEKVFIRDDYGDSPISHRSDISRGGSDNIISASGDESGGVTAIEFIIPLDSGDDKDKIIVPGKTYRVIYAVGRRDNFTSLHFKRGSLDITF